MEHWPETGRMKDDALLTFFKALQKFVLSFFFH